MYVALYDMIWYAQYAIDMRYEMLHDIMWCDIWYDESIWFAMIWCMIFYMVWYMLCDDIWYMRWYSIWYDIWSDLWYDMR